MHFFFCSLLIFYFYWVPTSHASSAIVLEVSAEHSLEVGGNWAIPIRHREQWWLGLGQASDFWVAPLRSSGFGVWQAEISLIKQLTTHGGLRDHSFRQCPNGDYLHVSGGAVGSDNIVYLYNSLFEPITQMRFTQEELAHATNDIQVLCGEYFRGFAAAESAGMRDYFVQLENPLIVQDIVEIPQSPRMTGAGLLEDGTRLLTVGVDPGPGLAVTAYNQQMEAQGRWEIPPASQGIVHYWPSRFMKIGSYYLIATMGKDPNEPWQFDFGDLYLLILNSGFSVVEWQQISHNDPVSGGGMRPWFDVDLETGQMLLGYDAINTLYLYELSLNMDVLLPPSPTAEPASESETETPTNAKVDGCGGLLFLPMVLLRRPRQRDNF